MGTEKSPFREVSMEPGWNYHHLFAKSCGAKYSWNLFAGCGIVRMKHDRCRPFPLFKLTFSKRWTSRNDGRRRCPMFKSGQHFSNVQVNGRRPCSMFNTMSNVQVRSTFSNVQVFDDFDPNIQCSSQLFKSGRHFPMFKFSMILTRISSVQVNFLETMDGDDVQCSSQVNIFPMFKSTFSKSWTATMFNVQDDVQCSSTNRHFPMFKSLIILFISNVQVDPNTKP